MISLQYHCTDGVADFLKSRLQLFDGILETLGKEADVSISVSAIMSKIIVETTKCSSSFDSECNAVMSQFLSQFKSSTVNFNQGLTAAAKAMAPNLFSSQSNLHMQCNESGGIVASGFSDDVDQRIQEIKKTLSQVASSVEFTYNFPTPENDCRTLNASGLLEELDRRHGTKLSIVCDSAEQMVKYKGYHEQIMSAKDDVDAFWKCRHSPSTGGSRSTSINHRLSLTFKCDVAVAKFITNYWPPRTRGLSSVTYRTVENGILVDGQKLRVYHALHRLVERTQLVQRNTFRYDVPGLFVYTSTDEWKKFRLNVETDNKCMVDVSKVTSVDPSSPPMSLPDGDVCMFSGVRVTVRRDDITRDESEVIVNGCGKDFNLKTGNLSKAIYRNAGQVIQDACDNNPIFTSANLRITQGYSLPSTYVIHVIIPPTASELSAIIREVLECVENLQAESVAIPALGTGGWGLDPKDVASAFFEAIGMVSTSRPAHIKKISFIIYDKPHVDVFRRAILNQQRIACIFERNVKIAKAKARRRTDADVAVSIYSRDASDLLKAQEAIERKLKEMFVEECLEDNVFLKFTFHDANDVYCSAAEHGVVVDTSRPPAIKLAGLRSNVADLKDAIKEMRSEFREATTYSKICRWTWSADDVTFHDFPLRVSRAIEQQFEENPDVMATVTWCGERISVNFSASAARFCDEAKRLGEIAIKRVDSMTTSGTPLEWEAMQGRSWKRVQLARSSAEYRRVASKFLSTCHCTIVKIERVQNPSLYEQYMIKKKDVQRHLASENPAERELFHGTSQSDAEKICAHGFDRGFAGKNATVYGHGVYFAVCSSLSRSYSTPNRSGVSVMFLARVLTGEYGLGHRHLKAPPMNASCADGRLFDSVVDNMKDPSMFVVFKDSSVYPSHMISFK